MLIKWSTAIAVRQDISMELMSKNGRTQRKGAKDVCLTKPSKIRQKKTAPRDSQSYRIKPNMTWRFQFGMPDARKWNRRNATNTNANKPKLPKTFPIQLMLAPMTRTRTRTHTVEIHLFDEFLSSSHLFGFECESFWTENGRRSLNWFELLNFHFCLLTKKSKRNLGMSFLPRCV